MAMTENIKQLIIDISKNDLQKAKRTAATVLAEDNTLKNKHFCEHYQNLLTQSIQSALDIPYDLKGMLEFVDLNCNYIPERVIISENDMCIVNTVIMKSFVADKMNQLNISYTNSLLLYGESGTGKTTLAKYIAYKMKLPFVYVNFSNLINSLLGKTAANLSKVFNYIRGNSCVLLIDELDAVGIHRCKESGDVSEMKRVTIALMQELDNLNNNVIVIGATNLYKEIDVALLRRFAIHHKVEYLNNEERKRLITNYLNSIEMCMNEAEMEEFANKYKKQSDLINAIVEWVAAAILEQESDYELIGLSREKNVGVIVD